MSAEVSQQALSLARAMVEEAAREMVSAAKGKADCVKTYHEGTADGFWFAARRIVIAGGGTSQDADAVAGAVQPSMRHLKGGVS